MMNQIEILNHFLTLPDDVLTFTWGLLNEQYAKGFKAAMASFDIVLDDKYNPLDDILKMHGSSYIRKLFTERRRLLTVPTTHIIFLQDGIEVSGMILSDEKMYLRVAVPGDEDTHIVAYDKVLRWP